VTKIANQKSKIKNEKGRLRLTATPAASPSTRLFVIPEMFNGVVPPEKKSSAGKNFVGTGRVEFREGKAGPG
jgi:hypothetical protein